MPIYEYECQKCSHKFELLRPIDDRDVTTECPKCGAKNVHRVTGGFMLSHYKGVHFKPAGEWRASEKHYPKPRHEPSP